VRSSSEHSDYGQARDDSAAHREVARRGRRADGARAGPTCGSVVIGYVVAAAACNKTHQEVQKKF
jgi:hypothetical protein